MQKNNRRGYRYHVYGEVSHIPKSTIQGERVNIFLTELNRRSALVSVTAKPSEKLHVYFTYKEIRSLLSHNRYKEALEDLISRNIISRIYKESVYQIPLFTFRPIQLIPIQENVRIRNKKVVNAVNHYFEIDGDPISAKVRGYLRTSLIKTTIHITDEDFTSRTRERYDQYLEEFPEDETPRSFPVYLEDMRLKLAMIRQYSQLSPEDRSQYIKTDDFSGRIYTIASGLPRWSRAYIRLNDEPVAEVDMIASHPYLLYNILKGTDFSLFLEALNATGEDFYTEYGELIGKGPRGIVKTRFLRSIYGRNDSSYFAEFKSIFPEAAAKIEEIKSIRIIGNPSKKGTYTNLSYKILKKEVRIFTRVWKELHSAGIMFLPIHDGVLIPLSQLEAGKRITEEIIRRSIPIAKTSIKYY